MRRKLFTTLIRLAASLIFIVGSSSVYMQAYGASRSAYEANNYRYSLRYYGEYRYRSDDFAKGFQYNVSYSREYSGQYRAAGFAQSYDYDMRYLDNYPNRYSVYTSAATYSYRRHEGYQRRNYISGKGFLASVRYYKGYANYQDGTYDTSLLVSYDMNELRSNAVTNMAQYYSGSQVSAKS
jgi:hypothetical protein